MTHLTDLQNTETTYAEDARQTLLAWGKIPHLVRAGTAKVEISADCPSQWTSLLALDQRRRDSAKCPGRWMATRLPSPVM